MFPRNNSKDDEMNTSNYCLFNEDSPKNDNKNSNNKKKKLENPKTTLYDRKKLLNSKLFDIQDKDNSLNNHNIYNQGKEDSFYNFKLFEDSHRGNKKSNQQNNFNSNINEIIQNNSDFNINDEIKNSINPLLVQKDEDKEHHGKNKNENKNIYNNIININNNFNNNIVNINNMNNYNNFNDYNKHFLNDNNDLNINNNINYIEDISNSFKEEKKENNININDIKPNIINKNNISEKNNINKENKKFPNFNKEIKLNIESNIKNEIDKMKQNMKLINNKNINKNNKSFVFFNNNNLINQKESEEEKRERELKEKEKNDIRDKLKCYLCFGKINKARLCLNCQKIACENCVKNMLLKHAKCLNCKKPSSLNDIILLPFMDDITNFFINIENNQRQNNQIEKAINNIIDESDDEKEDIKNKNNIDIKDKNNEKEEKNKNKCQKHKDKYTEYYCFQCGEYLCPKCLLFFDQDVAEKHRDHTIISFEDLKYYNIKEAINEYNKLKNSKKELEQLLAECKLKIKQLTIKKDIGLKNLEEAKKELEWNYIEKINILKDLSKTAEDKIENIENSIDSVPNSFSNIIIQKDFNQGKQIFKELKKINSQIIPLEELNPKKESKKNNIYFETFESDEINLVLPENGIYLEELNIYDNEIKLIDQHQCKLKIDLLGGNFIFTLTIKLENEYYNKYHPMFKGYFILINSENRCEFANFMGNIYTNGEQILSIELGFEDIKNIIGESNKFRIICGVDKIYYK